MNIKKLNKIQNIKSPHLHQIKVPSWMSSKKADK